MKMYAFTISIFVLSTLIPQSGLAGASTAGKFKATMGDKTYDLDVTCDKFSKDKVMFISDVESGYGIPKDTTGDNIAVSGLGNALSLTLMFYVKGESFVGKSSYKGNKKLDLKMSGNTLTGKGEMLGSGYFNPIIDFTLTCQ